MSSPVPLRYRVAKAQVAQFIEVNGPSLLSNRSPAVLGTIAYSNPGASTVSFDVEPNPVEYYLPPEPADPDPEPGEPGAGAPY